MDENIVTEVKTINRDPGPAFIAFSLPCDPDLAILKFESRYGFTPDEVKEVKRYLMVGPIPNPEERVK